MSSTSLNVGTPRRDNRKVDASTQVSPGRLSDVAPIRTNATAQLSQGIMSSPSSTTTGGTTTTTAAGPTHAGVMRSQRHAIRHDPLARPMANTNGKKVTNGNKHDGKENVNDQTSASNGFHVRAQTDDKDDGLDGVEADVDELVGPDDSRSWMDDYPGLRQIQRVSFLPSPVRGLRGCHDDSEQGLKFMSAGFDFD